MTTAIVSAIEPGIIPASLPESLTTEQLVEITIGTFQRIQTSMPYIIELRKRFKAAPRGKANIGGYDTWEEFCEARLHRTASAIRKALQAEKRALPESTKSKPHKTVASPAAPASPVSAEPLAAPAAPQTSSVEETFYVARRKVGGFLFRFSGNVFEPTKHVGEASRFAEPEEIEMRIKRRDGSNKVLEDSKWEWVKVQATYQLTALAPAAPQPAEPPAVAPGSEAAPASDPKPVEASNAPKTFWVIKEMVQPLIGPIYQRFFHDDKGKIPLFTEESQADTYRKELDSDIQVAPFVSPLQVVKITKKYALDPTFTPEKAVAA